MEMEIQHNATDQRRR